MTHIDVLRVMFRQIQNPVDYAEFDIQNTEDVKFLEVQAQNVLESILKEEL